MIGSGQQLFCMTCLNCSQFWYSIKLWPIMFDQEILQCTAQFFPQSLGVVLIKTKTGSFMFHTHLQLESWKLKFIKITE